MMNRKPIFTASAYGPDATDDRIGRLKEAFLASKYRKDLIKSGSISYEVTLEGICRNILLANYSDRPEYNHQLLDELKELKKTALQFAIDELHLNSLPIKLQGAIYQLIEIDPWELSLLKKRGRRKSTKSERVAREVLIEYRQLYKRAKASHSINGDFVNLLTTVFGILGISENVEHAARKAITNLEKKQSKSGKFSPSDSLAPATDV